MIFINSFLIKNLGLIIFLEEKIINPEFLIKNEFITIIDELVELIGMYVNADQFKELTNKSKMRTFITQLREHSEGVININENLPPLQVLKKLKELHSIAPNKETISTLIKVSLDYATQN